ncbi:hypothetical protein [Paracoccus marcusii]|uniref:hypothetical protein n=1 Tax=Paracoccus marcusii TaxID=59779 RepID=UPI0032677F0F
MARLVNRHPAHQARRLGAETQGAGNVGGGDPATGGAGEAASLAQGGVDLGRAVADGAAGQIVQRLGGQRVTQLPREATFCTSAASTGPRSTPTSSAP